MTTNSFGIWLTSDNNNSILAIPIAPESLDESIAADNTTVDIAQKGRVTIMGERKLLVYKFSSIFPATYSPDALVPESELRSPQYYRDAIRAFMEAKKPVRFIVTGRVDLLCTIESFQPQESGGDVGSLEYSIELHEWRTTSVRKVDLTPTGTATVTSDPTREENTTVPRKYTVLDGDCLYKIARKVLGDSSRWREIYELNQNVVRKNYIIWAGMVLTMPER